MRIDRDIDRLGHTNCIAHLHFALAGQTCCHDVFSHITCCVSCGAVDLGGVLTGECATAVTACATIGIDNDLATRQTAIALGSADHKTTSRVDQELGLGRQQTSRETWTDDVLDHGLVNRCLRDFRRMLCRQHYSIDLDRLAIDVAESHLRLGIGTQPGQAAVFTQLALTLHQTVCVPDWGRHQIRRFVTCVTKHQTLVARALIEIVLGRAIHALRDVGRLFVVGDQHCAAFVVDAVVGVVVANPLDGVTRDLDVVHVCRGGDFTSQHDQTGVTQRFSCHTRVGVLGENRIQNRIGDLVGDLVWMSFGN